jgi:hypothetical protein
MATAQQWLTSLSNSFFLPDSIAIIESTGAVEDLIGLVKDRGYPS